MKNIFYSLIILLIVSCSNDKNETTLNQAINKTEIDSNLSYIQSADLLVTGDFDFGTVSQSASQSKIVTIKNTGLIPGKVKIDLTTIFQTNGIFSINYASSDCFVSSSYKILQSQYSCQIELLLTSGVTASGAIFAAIPLYDELASNTLIKNLQASVVISSTGSTPPVGKSCITAYHKDLITGKCVSDYKDCTPLISNAVVAKKHWNSVNQTFDSCLATSCVPSYAPANGGSSCALSSQTITINKLINQGISNIYDAGTNALIESCPVNSSSCAILVPALSNIRIESIGSNGYGFTNYSDSNCLGVNFACSKSSINSNLTITPLFSIQNYTLTVAILPSNLNSDSTYSILKNGVACSTPACLSSFNFGQTVQITATPNQYVNVDSITLSDGGIAKSGINPISFSFGLTNLTANINLSDKPLTVPLFVFNGSLSSGLITIANDPLSITTSNIPMARTMLISESADCSTGSYIPYVATKLYTHSITTGIRNISFQYKNNTQTSSCFNYTVKATNTSRACTPQPANTQSNGTQSSTDSGTTWTTCSGYVCSPLYTDLGSAVCSQTNQTQSCNITDGTATITGVGSRSTSNGGQSWTTCSVTSCNSTYHTENNLTCISNTRSCLVTNGSGVQAWNTSNLSWGSCIANACTGIYVPYAGACILPISRACNPQPANSTVNGTQISNDNGATWQGCTGFTCSPTYTAVGSICSLTNQSRACTSQPAGSTGGTETTSNGGQSWSACSGFTCTQSNYAPSGSACVFTRPLLTNTTSVTINRRGSTCSISNGKAYCWSINGGQTASALGVVGIAGTSIPTVPYPVNDSGALSGKTMIKITSSDNYFCALDNTGKAYCWGVVPRNGTWSTPTQITTTGVLAGKTLTDIKAAGDTVCALASTGEVFCFGQNYNYAMGVTTPTTSAVPVLAGVSGITSLFGGIDAFGVFCGKNSSNNIYCWGSNYPFGIIGYFDNSTPTYYKMPAMISDDIGVTTFNKMVFGAGHSCFISTNNRFTCRGNNDSRQKGYLGSKNGINNYLDYIPQQVSTGIVNSPSSIIDMSAGGTSTCVVYSNNNVQCWGDDYSNNNSSVSANVTLPLSGRGITKLFMSGYGATSLRGCGLNSTGQLYCWYTSDLNGTGTLIQ